MGQRFEIIATRRVFEIIATRQIQSKREVIQCLGCMHITLHHPISTTTPHQEYLYFPFRSTGPVITHFDESNSCATVQRVPLHYRSISGIRSTAIRSNKVSKRQGPIRIKTIRSYDRNLTHEGRPPDLIPDRLSSVPHPSKMNKPTLPARQLT